jgi:hypothetical protein
MVLLLRSGALSELGRFYQAAAPTSLQRFESTASLRCCCIQVRCLSWAASTKRLAPAAG